MFVLQDWIKDIPLMQQSVLLCAIRGPDGMAKHHPCKPLIRWYRRCILITAFEKKAITNPYELGGGSFTGPSCTNPEETGKTWEECMVPVADDFLNCRDELPLHYFMHFMHAAEILGYQHSDLFISNWWLNLYIRMAEALHLHVETRSEMMSRLGDNEEGWLARSDTSETKIYKANKLKQ